MDFLAAIMVGKNVTIFCNEAAFYITMYTTFRLPNSLEYEILLHNTEPKGPLTAILID